MTSPRELGLRHHYEPGQRELPTLLLLHGTGGSEESLLPLGRALLPGAGLLSPRGAVLEHGQPRFFKRLAEGVFDQEDLKLRTAELALFLQDAAIAYGFDPERVVAVGFSNGANIASSLMLSGTGALSGAVLLRGMVPFEPAALPRLDGIPVLISAGQEDPIVPLQDVERLATLLRESGAAVELLLQPGGHGLTKGDVVAATNFLAQLAPTASGGK
jgi:predicted esterase